MYLIRYFSKQMSKRTFSQTQRAKFQKRGPPQKRNRVQTVATGQGRIQMMMGPAAAFQPTSAEIKAVDLAEQTYVFRDPNTTSNILLLNGIQTGSGFFNRVGSRIEMKNLQLNGFLGPQAGVSSTTPTQLRVMIVYDRQPTGALPVISDIIQDRDQTGAASTGGLSHINLDNRDRFSIIRDMRWAMPTNTAGVLSGVPSGVGAEWTVNEFIKLKGLGVHFKSSANPTTIADIATGALYACFIAETNDNRWVIEAGFRLRYDDK